MKLKPTISIFFPAYNEENNIEQAVYEAELAIKVIARMYEIIIINDGSTDRTGEIADSLALENKKIRVVHHKQNKGYGAAVWSGIQAAHYEYIFFTDADLQFDIRELGKLIPYLASYDTILGYRAKRNDPLIRLINAKGWNILNRLMFGLKVRDIDCAFKLIKRSLIKELPIKARGAMLSAEMLIRLQRNGVAFKEVPVTHLPRRRGEATGARPEVILRALKEMFQLYKNDLGNVTHWQIAKFGLVGLMNTGIDIGAYFTLTRYIPYFVATIFLAKIVSFFLGTISSFILNRQWTFQIKGKFTANEIFRFYSVVGTAMLINLGSMYIFVSLLRIHDLASVFIATLLTFVWSFIFSKLWVFNKQRKSEEVPMGRTQTLFD